jgi:urocanate hydratase
MGGAQGLAITMNQGLASSSKRTPAGRATAALAANRCATEDLEQALAWVDEALGQNTPKSIAVIGNAADVLPRLLQDGLVPDVVTDQTAAHDVLYGYIPAGVTLEEANTLRVRDPERYTELAMASMARRVETLLAWQAKGSGVSRQQLRQRALDAGVRHAFDYPGFVPAYIRPLFCTGKGPFRWVALSGDAADIYATDRAIMELFPDNEHLVRWIQMAGEKVAFQGLPARICWLGYGERLQAGLRFNDMVLGA